jgi:hypothetical protein
MRRHLFLWPFNVVPIIEFCSPPHLLLVCSYWTGYELVWQPIVISPFFFFTFFKNINSKTFKLFYIFYITSVIFYYYSNKKIHYKTKLFHFSIKHSQILYHINHFLLHNTQIFHNPITYQTSPYMFLHVIFSLAI